MKFLVNPGQVSRHGKRRKSTHRKRPTSRRAKTASTSVAKGDRMARRSTRRKSAKRRVTRRFSAFPKRRRRHTLHANPPKRRGRRRAHTVTRKRSTARRGFRRNPPRGGIVRSITGALVDGAMVTGGAIGQNFIVRALPDLVPATMAGAAMLNGAIKDVIGLVGGAFVAVRFAGADRGRFIMAGQASAAIARQIRAANIPTVSTLLGEYDPIRLGRRHVGAYSSGFPGAGVPTSRAALPPGTQPGNVTMLKSLGIYSDGVPYSPSMY